LKNILSSSISKEDPERIFQAFQFFDILFQSYSKTNSIKNEPKEVWFPCLLQYQNRSEEDIQKSLQQYWNPSQKPIILGRRFTLADEKTLMFPPQILPQIICAIQASFQIPDTQHYIWQEGFAFIFKECNVVMTLYDAEVQDYFEGERKKSRVKRKYFHSSSHLLDKLDIFICSTSLHATTSLLNHLIGCLEETHQQFWKNLKLKQSAIPPNNLKTLDFSFLKESCTVFEISADGKNLHESAPKESLHMLIPDLLPLDLEKSHIQLQLEDHSIHISIHAQDIQGNKRNIPGWDKFKVEILQGTVKLEEIFSEYKFKIDVQDSTFLHIFGENGQPFCFQETKAEYIFVDLKAKRITFEKEPSISNRKLQGLDFFAFSLYNKKADIF